jgi:hypothetical protein
MRDIFSQAGRAEIEKARKEWRDRAEEFKRCEVIFTNEEGRLVRDEFATVDEAAKVHPWVSQRDGMRGKIDGHDCFRFESREAYRMLSE